MTDKEKLDRLKKLADAMYYAAQYLTTDASGLRKAMEEYHKFIIHEYNKQEPTIEDLEQASKEWLRPQLDKSYAEYGERKMMELTHFDGYAMLDAVEFGAQWQREHELKPDFSGMIIHNYLKDCWQFCDGEIPTDKCINPDYINVDVFITSKKKE